MVSLAGRLNAVSNFTVRATRVLDDDILSFHLMGPTPADGKWTVRVYSIAWRIEDQDELVVGVDDDEPFRSEDVKVLNRQQLVGVTVSPPTMLTTFTFDRYRLLVFPVTSVSESQNWQQWSLRSPDGTVVDVGPGDSWSLRS